MLDGILFGIYIIINTIDKIILMKEHSENEGRQLEVDGI
jgi:hypothetical protein